MELGVNIASVCTMYMYKILCYKISPYFVDNYVRTPYKINYTSENVSTNAFNKNTTFPTKKLKKYIKAIEKITSTKKKRNLHKKNVGTWEKPGINSNNREHLYKN